MAWLSIILAGLLEVLGVYMIKQLNEKRKWYFLVLLLLGFGSSFYLLSFAMETVPMGTAYAVWTGIGASGGAIVGMVFYGESRDWKRLLFITMVLSSAIGLKLISG